MTLEEFIDMCELSLCILVADYTPSHSYLFRLPTKADFKRKIMRVVSANYGEIFIVLKNSE